jgi:hypothetical protein
VQIVAWVADETALEEGNVEWRCVQINKLESEDLEG